MHSFTHGRGEGREEIVWTEGGGLDAGAWMVGLLGFRAAGESWPLGFRASGESWPLGFRAAGESWPLGFRAAGESWPLGWFEFAGFRGGGEQGGWWRGTGWLVFTCLGLGLGGAGLLGLLGVSGYRAGGYQGIGLEGYQGIGLEGYQG